MSDAPVVHIDPEAFWADPYPALAEMRAKTPICFVPELNATLLTKRDDIHTCEKNVQVFSSDQPGGLMNELMGKNMMRSDGDEHRKERFVYYRAVSPRTVKVSWAQEFDRLADAVPFPVASRWCVGRRGLRSRLGQRQRTQCGRIRASLHGRERHRSGRDRAPGVRLGARLGRA